MKATNTNNAMEQGKVTFVIDDACGNSPIEYSTLEEALNEHLNSVVHVIHDSIDYDRGRSDWYDSWDYVKSFLSTWQVEKRVDGEEVAFYWFQENDDPDAFTTEELKAIKIMHDKAVKEITPIVQKELFPGELEA